MFGIRRMNDKSLAQVEASSLVDGEIIVFNSFTNY